MSEDAPAHVPATNTTNPASRRRPSSARNTSMEAGRTSVRGPSTDGPHPAPTLDLSETTVKQSMDRQTLEEILSPTGATTPNPFGPRAGTLDLDDYFVSIFRESKGVATDETNESDRSGPGISGSTRSGLSSCGCTVVSSPR